MPSDWIPRTKTGQLKRRLSYNEKLIVLGMGDPLDKMRARLDVFNNLFAYRRCGSIVTRAGKGPRDWTTLRHHLKDEVILRHLLGGSHDQKPTWAGCRSFATTKFVAIDVDADRGGQSNSAPDTSFAKRCDEVERAFRRMGIDPSDPSVVLVQPTPSGGRHYYFFLMFGVRLAEIIELLEEAGITHVPGRTEIFPSENHGFRLPFGAIPGRSHDPKAWIKFVDAYKEGHIRLFKMEELRTVLKKHGRRHRRQHVSKQISKVYTNTRRSVRPVEKPPVRMVKPRRLKLQTAPALSKSEKFQGMIEKGITSKDEVVKLLRLGIQKEGTRKETMKILAAHFVWICGMGSDDAARKLTDWLMDHRHKSKDIVADLNEGTEVVARHAERMCKWYEKQRQTDPYHPPLNLRFRQSEVAALTAVQKMPAELRHDQAMFLLHFLAYAKEHGLRAADGQSYVASPAVNAVIRRWPGCGKTGYQVRIASAEHLGVLRLVRGKWQNPNGQGRARTYRIAVPVKHDPECLTLGDAIGLLTRIDPPRRAPVGQLPPPQPTEARLDNGATENLRHQSPTQLPSRASIPGTLPSTSSRRSLATGSHPSDRTPAQLAGLPRRFTHPGTLTPASGGQSSDPPIGDDNQRRELDAAHEEFVRIEEYLSAERLRLTSRRRLHNRRRYRGGG